MKGNDSLTESVPAPEPLTDSASQNEKNSATIVSDIVSEPLTDSVSQDKMEMPAAVSNELTDSVSHKAECGSLVRQENARLRAQVAQLENELATVQYRLDHIINNPLWKMTKPFRYAINTAGNYIHKVKACGGIGGVPARLKARRAERDAKLSYGAISFPDESRIEEELGRQWEYSPKISILVPLYNTPERFLHELLDSVMAQTYENWELCFADGSDDGIDREKMLRQWAGDSEVLTVDLSLTDSVSQHNRIKYCKLSRNGGISENTNAALQLATGEYIGLLDHDDILHPEVLYYYVQAINEQGADYLYCDEVTFDSKKGGRYRGYPCPDLAHLLNIHFKPDYAPDTLRANNYICHFSVFRSGLLTGTELFRTQYNGSQDHDMILRLTDKAQHIVHVPHIFYYWRSHSGSTAEDLSTKPYAIAAAKSAVAEHLRSHGLDGFEIESTKAFDVIFRIRYAIIGQPLISIVIPTSDHVEDLSRCVSSILAYTTWPRIEIVIVDNNSTKPQTQAYYRSLEQEPMVRIEHIDMDSFNYATVCNLGVSKATGDYIVLLNNDTEVITPEWLEEMLMYAQREDVGAVGAKLLYPDKTAQHAGVIIGIGAHGTAGHAHYGVPYDNYGYMGRLCYAQDLSAVTGACLMVRSSLYRDVDGLDEQFAISLNDVDFCLKLRRMGLLNVFTPFAELYHYESASRGLDMQDAAKAARYESECELFRTRWAEVLSKGDPYYNPNFLTDPSFGIAYNSLVKRDLAVH